MSIILLYYITGTFVTLLTLALSVLSVISMEDMFVLTSAGILLIVLGVVQHLLLFIKFDRLRIENHEEHLLG